MPQTILSQIQAQIDAAKFELLAYRPVEMNWPTRTLQSARVLIPRLESLATGLKGYVEDVLNAPEKLRSLWAAIRDHVDLPRETISEFERLLGLDDALRESVTGEVVSKVVTKYLTNHETDLHSNGRSDYPDLYLASSDYSGLPTFKRHTGDDRVYGAAIKGRERRPVRVPDGIEIKTCRDSIRVDCHHPHPGLHLALLFSEVHRRFTVTDVAIAFLASSDYREAGRNTTATTPKYSFNGTRFVSLLPSK